MGLKISTKNILILLALVLLVGCSTKNGAWLNRNFHAMGTYYNTLYNGNLALEQGKLTLVQDYRDNYWEILPVERMQVKEAADFATDTTKNQDFVRAEEKATKAIQKHSILIDGQQYNYQMDEAFLLLGKARYYDQRFVPALDAFNYILSNYDSSSTIVNTRVWKAKTQLRMDYSELALKNLEKLLKEYKELDDENLVSVSATLAQAYINLEKPDSAIAAIAVAAEKTKNHEQRGRFLFIKGQLYDGMEMTDSANVAFDEIIALKRRTPRVYRIHAFMEKGKNFDYENGDLAAQLKLLNHIAENRENRPYLDNIYYQLGEYYFATDSVDTSMVYYNKSLRENGTDTYLNSRNYLVLGNINFDRAEYKEAGAYYDSTLINIAENTREYRKLQKKRDNLDDVILYEDIAVKNDSILNLVAMSEAERLAYFKEYTEKNKTRALEEALTLLEESKKADQNTGAGEFFEQNKPGSQQNAGGFYFYDPTQVAYGKLSFKKIWGDRKLQDNWRTDDSKSGNKDSEKEEEELTEEAVLAGLAADPQYDPATYIAKIPNDPAQIDSLKSERDFAYYQLGVIYKEKFQEYELAANKLEALLTNQPEERLILPSKYNLYKIYSITGETQKANRWKQDILTNHADSRYAAIILNPTEYDAGEDSPEAVYERVYEKYLAQEFQTVIDTSAVLIFKFTGDPIVPKFELLKATAIGRVQGFEAYKTALNEVALNYPLSEEGKKAQQLYSDAIPAMTNKEFAKDDPEDTYKLFYVFPKEERTAADSLKVTLDKAITELGFAELNTTIDIYNPEKLLLVVHGLQSPLGALGLGEKFRESEEYEIKNEFFGISTTNYKIILIHKNLDAYLLTQSQLKP